MWRITIALVCLALVMGSGAAAMPDYGLDESELIDGAPPPWSEPLMPAFVQASEDFHVPLDLLLALAYFGSNFENRAFAPTIEKGFGLMALRINGLSSESLAEAKSLTGATENELKLDPVASIRGAAAVLDDYAKAKKINRDKGLDAWLDCVIKYAGLDDECSRIFAGEVYGLFQRGLDYTNRAGERFIIEPQETSVDVEALYGTANQVASTDYGPAVWNAAASCNYSAYTTSKDTYIVHTVEGSYAGCISWFKNCAASCSAHYVTAYDGRITQMVREAYVAWHVSCYNSWSIGNEHEGYAASSSHPTAQYNASALLAREICNERGMPKAHRAVRPGILGHIDVTRCCCGTHTDPGNGWDWNYYIGQVVGAPPAPTWAATYRAQSFPSSMVAGSTAIVWAEFNNTGTGTWTHSHTYLGTSSPQDRSSPFCNTPNWASCNRTSDVDQTSVGNGAVGRFTFILKAPATPGTYTEKYKLVQEGVTWFGPEISWTITVTAAKGNLTGTVRNAANSAAISGATVALSGGASTTTNSSGVYTFSNINAGTYTVNVSAAGFNSASGSATVSSNATATKDFSLTPTDTTAPSAPSGLTATAISPSQINLSWTASTDNVGVTGYNVYRGGTQVGTATGTTFQDNGLAQNTSYSYTVKAKDAANNLSAASNTATATTFPGTVPIFEDGFANLDYWVPLVEGSMPGPYPPVLDAARNHGTWTGSNSLRTRTSDVSTQGCLIGHEFVPAFAQAKFETWFFDGGGVGYEAKFEGTTDGWASTNQGGNAAYDTLVSVSGALRGGSSSDTTIAGWTSGCHKEITSGFAAGQPYSLTMSVKWPAAPAGKSWTTPPRCFVQFFDGAGGVIQTDYSANIATDNAWHAYSVSGTVPAGTAKIWAGHWGYVNATVTPLYYYADNVSFTTNAGAELNDASRQGLQVRCIDSVGTVRAIYYIGTYSASPGTFKTYSVGNYKVCGAGCTGWYWPGAAIKTRTAGWHKFTLDFLPYTGTGDVKAYIDGALVATLDRTLDTQTHGLNMVAYGYHYRVNQEAWFDDVAMYAAQPHPAPTPGATASLSPTAIRWNFTDNSNNEIGFKVVDAANTVKATTGALTGTGSAGAIDEGGLAPNTAYTRTLRAFNGTLDSFSSAAVTEWTLAAPPTTGAIVCDKPVDVWTNAAQFTFTAVGGFGAGTVAGYRYVWNQSPTHTFAGTETVWDSGDLPLPVGSEGSWYLHVQALNGEGTPGGTLDLGPYKYDGTAPENPGMATETGGAETGVVQSEVSDPAFTWPAGTDALSGIQGYSVYFGDDSSGTSETFVTSAEYDPAGVSATGTYYLRVRARDGAGNDADEWKTIFTFIYSADAPTAPFVSDAGPYSPVGSTLQARWTESTSASDIVEYQYAVGTSSSTQDVVGWTSAGLLQQADIAIPAPGLVAGQTYYVFVKALDAVGRWSEIGASDGITVVATVERIGDAKALEDGTPVAFAGKYVSANLATGSNTDGVIQEPDRASGIAVDQMEHPVGTVVSVAGVITTQNQIRTITDTVAIATAAASPETTPVPLRIRADKMGGEALNTKTAGITGGVGLNNVGLLVTVQGKVTEFLGTDTRIGFLLDDTSVKLDGTPLLLQVSSGLTVDLSGLEVGDLVRVTGISTLEENLLADETVVVIPTLRVRGEPGDVTLLN